MAPSKRTNPRIIQIHFGDKDGYVKRIPLLSKNLHQQTKMKNIGFQIEKKDIRKEIKLARGNDKQKSNNSSLDKSTIKTPDGTSFMQSKMNFHNIKNSH